MPTEPPAHLPNHVALIMDGNGRWAKARGLPRKAGHRAGAETVRKIANASLNLGIKYLTLYAFSSENWQRPPAEIKALMGLLENFLTTKARELGEKNIRLQAIGRTHLLPASCRDALQKVISETSQNSGLTLILALSYGSREEITDATQRLARKIADGSLTPDQITPETLAAQLDTSPYPDPDLLIRTSGEFRLSNFLLWQLSYAEIVISPKNWPDFDQNDFLEALQTYATRHRRFGRI